MRAESPIEADDRAEFPQVCTRAAFGAADGRADEFDTIARLAAQICEVPIALVNVIGADSQWSRASFGLPDLLVMPHRDAFCDVAIRERALIEIADAKSDPRFAEHRLVVGEPFVRFFAGAPMLTSDGYAIGTVCVIDHKPRALTNHQRQSLAMLADLVVELVTARSFVPKTTQDHLATLSASVEHAAAPLLILQSEGNYERSTCTYVNRAFSNAFGYAPADIVGRTPTLLFGPKTDLATIEQMRADVLTGSALGGEFVLYDRHRIAHIVDVHTRVVPAIDGNVSNLVLTFRDITEQRAAERKLAKQLERTRALYLVTRMRDLTGHGQIDTVLELALASLGLDFGFVARCDHENISILNCAGSRRVYEPGATVPLAETWLRHAMANDDVQVFQKLSRDAAPSGSEREYPGLGAYIVVPISAGGKIFGAVGFLGEDRHEPYDDADREFVRLIGSFIGAALERKMQKEQLDGLAFTDALTGLSNRTQLFERIEAAIARTGRGEARFSIFYLDLDGFKSVNDRGGHATGDAVLREIAHRLRASMRESDTVARIGGDEFVIIAAPHNDDVALALAYRLIDAVTPPIETSEGVYAVGVSIGIATYPHDGASVRALLAAADGALYSAKTLGKGTAVCCSATNSA